uniref:Uncharacterized protein n=1 Tax=Anguilla anguilla TaxID=7936 RepID=A0A0E9Q207_ANGAN
MLKHPPSSIGTSSVALKRTMQAA